MEAFSKDNITVVCPTRFSSEQDPAAVSGLFVSLINIRISPIRMRYVLLQVRDAHINVINSFEDKAIQILCAVCYSNCAAWSSIIIIFFYTG